MAHELPQTPPTGLEAPYDLDSTAAARFRDDGFIRLPNVLDAQTIGAYEPEITSKVIELNTQHLPLEERSTYDRAFLQVSNLWEHSDVVKTFVQSRRLAKIAADLLGVDGVRLYHDQALYKEPGGGITPWHADQYYWPVSTDRCVTVWIPLQETGDDMGPLEFARGSHRLEYGRDMEIGDESEAVLQRELDGADYPTVSGAFDVGEVSYHLGWTFHRAAPNRSAMPRRVMTIIYIDADIVVTEPANKDQHRDLGRWMPGATVGAPPDTPLNPVLYQRT